MRKDDRPPMTDLRDASRYLRNSAFWRPSNARLLVATRPWRQRSSGETEAAERWEAAGRWLGRAQDATGDGGVSWAYQLRYGWGPSYPETTGYIVPTFLALADRLDDPTFRERAERAIGFLLPLQLPGGAFPGGVLDGGEPQPSIFNTGQIICGLTAWYQATGDEVVRRAACAAADWLGSVQDDDGAWRRHGYLGYPVTYTAHSSCWVAELGAVLDEPRFKATASRHLDWCLSQQDPDTDWFERSGFSVEDHGVRQAVTHTYAYTLWGVLHGGLAIGREDAVEGSRRSARRMADLVERAGWLPGMVGADNAGHSSYACLTGNAQMALVWQRLVGLAPDPAMTAASDRVIELVGAAQQIDESNDGIRGGVPGSDPVWGAYTRLALPNWAAKFYIDALLGQAPST
jgi:hypothetical protein